MSDGIKEWKALYNFHTSPFHPHLKAIVNCIWAHRDWKSLKATVSQATIASECGFGKGVSFQSGVSSVKKYVKLAADLGFFTITPGKSKRDCTTYAFDLSAQIWQQNWTKQELAAKSAAAIPSPGRGSRTFQTPSPSQGSDPSPSQPQIRRRVDHLRSFSSKQSSSWDLDDCLEETLFQPPSGQEAGLILVRTDRPIKLPAWLAMQGLGDKIPVLDRPILREMAGIGDWMVTPANEEDVWRAAWELIDKPAKDTAREVEHQRKIREAALAELEGLKPTLIDWLLDYEDCDDYLTGLRKRLTEWSAKPDQQRAVSPFSPAQWNCLFKNYREAT